MNGICPTRDVVGAEGSRGSSGIERGRLGFCVADVGIGGSERRSGVRPGTRSATTFWMVLAFYPMFRF